ncbi:MAG: cobalamin-dependent protein [Candidatus Omnitrophota bacterium]
MKVLFIYFDTASSEPPRIGMGVAYLSAYLKKSRHASKLCYFRSSEDINHVLTIIKEWSPNIIAYSATTSSFFSISDVTKKVKADFPDLFQICGGYHISMCPDEFLNRPELDAICVGYGEQHLLELAEAIQNGKKYLNIRNIFFRHNGKIIKNALRPFPKELDSFMPCDRQIFMHELRRFSIPIPFGGIFGENLQEFIFCRGCPFDCSFCCNHAFKKMGVGKYICYPSVSKCIKNNLFKKEENQKIFKERKDTILKLSYFTNEFMQFYLKNFKNLIQFEYLSNKYKIIKKLLPLNLRNQKIIA